MNSEDTPEPPELEAALDTLRFYSVHRGIENVEVRYRLASLVADLRRLAEEEGIPWEDVETAREEVEHARASSTFRAIMRGDDP